jgi:hypothetical protein
MKQNISVTVRVKAIVDVPVPDETLQDAVKHSITWDEIFAAMKKEVLDSEFDVIGVSFPWDLD